MSNIEKQLQDKFWYETPGVLFKTNRLVEFFPHYSMSDDEKLNALTRLMIYLSIVLYLYSGKYYYLFISLIGIIFTYLIYTNRSKIEGLENLDSTYLNYGDNKYPLNIVSPTKDNPFMNVLLTDYTDNPKRQAKIKVDIDKTKIKQNIEDKFNINLYKDLSDVFNKQSSQRQYYTTAITTIPNDQGKFARWLYNTPKGCKEGNQSQCTANQYIPLKRHLAGRIPWQW